VDSSAAVPKAAADPLRRTRRRARLLQLVGRNPPVDRRAEARVRRARGRIAGADRGVSAVRIVGVDRCVVD